MPLSEDQKEEPEKATIDSNNNNVPETFCNCEFEFYDGEGGIYSRYACLKCGCWY